MCHCCLACVGGHFKSPDGFRTQSFAHIAMLIRHIFPNHFVPALQVIRSNYDIGDSWLFIEGLTYKQPLAAGLF